MNDLYANIIVDITTDALNKGFIFKIPERLKDSIKQGMKVVFPFGIGNHDKEGFVLEVLTYEALTKKSFYKKDKFFKDKDAFSKIKEIKDIAKGKISVSEVLLKMAIYMCKEYYAPISNCLNTVLPVKKEVRKNSRQVDAVEKYKIDETEKNEKNNIVLNDEQIKVIKDILTDYKKGIFTEHLVCGVTGSGKTEIYINIIEEVLKENKTAIVLIPEIALTHQTVIRLKNRFSSDVAIIHSKMSKGEKYIQYKKCEDGSAKILVGPRSAIFAPFDKLGLVVIDEVNDASYKSDNSPRYETLDVARFRCKEQNATLITLSATPNITLYYDALNNNNIKLHRLSRRASSILPKVTVVDMRKENKAGNHSLFSRVLIEKINDRLNKNEQVMLYINRRGFDTIYTCKSCGETITCPHCDVSMVLHNDGKLKCHYCGYEIREPLDCPNCHSIEIDKYGEGTEKVEEMCIDLFPKAKILRMDRDTTKEKDGHDKIIEKFKNHEADILIGTQMIVKGHDFKDVTLVAIMRADLSLYKEGYRASENAYSMITQCIGRSGRKIDGESIVQVYDVENEVIDEVKNQDFHKFYEKEIVYREKLKYPPFSKLLYVKLNSTSEDILSEMANNLKTILDMKNDVGAVVLGPTSNNPYRMKDIYYINILVKCDTIEQAKRFRKISNDFIKYADKFDAVSVTFDIE